uniref:Protein Asterix n=1 Tax=Parascaris equorum TaxID=6256 RepID=A0A914RPW6_PAREQ
MVGSHVVAPLISVVGLLRVRHPTICNATKRYKPVDPQSAAALADDPIPEYMNVLGMIFSMCGLMMRVCSSASHLFSPVVTFGP